MHSVKLVNSINCYMKQIVLRNINTMKSLVFVDCGFCLIVKLDHCQFRLFIICHSDHFDLIFNVIHVYL